MGKHSYFYLIIGTIGGYFFGSIPFSWILVRMVKGIDMRYYGSRTVSGSMVGVLLSKPAAAFVGILDILKALIPVWLGQKLHFGELLPMAIGVGAFIGHCWPVWLKFQGGRGVSVIMGASVVLFPIGPIVILIALGLGKILNAGGVMVLISLGLLPILTTILHKPLTFTLFYLILFLLTVIKRLEANREPLPKKERGKVLLRRVFLDRDIADLHTWLHRRV